MALEGMVAVGTGYGLQFAHQHPEQSTITSLTGSGFAYALDAKIYLEDWGNSYFGIAGGGFMAPLDFEVSLHDHRDHKRNGILGRDQHKNYGAYLGPTLRLERTYMDLEGSIGIGFLRGVEYKQSAFATKTSPLFVMRQEFGSAQDSSQFGWGFWRGFNFL